VTPDGRKVFVANSLSKVIDTATDVVIAGFPVGLRPVAFGQFIEPAKQAPPFAGIPGASNCFGQSVSALVQRYGGLNAAAAALMFPGIRALQNAVIAFCEA
jgi:YVTN family beta-propeller protein